MAAEEKKDINFLLISIFVVIIIAAVVFYFINKAKIQTPASNTNKSIFPLVYGSTGMNVASVQSVLNRIDPTLNLPIDGILGADTKSALLRYGKFPLDEKAYNELLTIA